MPSDGSIRFGVFEVDLAARELRKRGVRMKLQDQPFRVLEALLEKPGEIVTREELKDRLWAHDEFVEFDKSVNTAVQKIRQALGDSAESPRFLETVPRIGYRFVAPVETKPTLQAESKPDVAENSADGLDWRRVAPWALAGALALLLVWTSYEGFTPAETSRQVRRLLIVPELTGAAVYSRAHQGGYPASAAISPHGTHVAYLSAENPPRLWLHDLSTGNSSPVDGTEYSADEALPGDTAFGAKVFWSPDGDSVGFSTRSSLKKYNIADGSVTVLHTLGSLDTVYCGAAWSPNGETIVFSAGTSGGNQWHVMPASGGDAAIIEIDRSGRMGNPAVVPSDDAAIIFHTSHRFSQALFVLRLSSGETSLLIENGKSPSWSPTGHVMFDRGGSVWALPFSTDTLEATGEAFLVEPGFSNGGVSRDGTLLGVTSHVVSEGYRLSMRDRGGELLREIASPLFRAYNPAVSPDGSKVAVSAARQPGVANDIWVFDVDGGGSLRLTTSPTDDDCPIWTHDSRRILFRTNSDTSADADFFVVDAGGGSVDTVLDNDRRVVEPSFSPDGTTLIYQERPLDGIQFDIRFIGFSEAGDQAEPVSWLETEFNELHPQFSPSGRHVAYGSGESGTGQIHIRPFPEGSPAWQVSVEGGSAPRWSRDGRELYWWSRANGFPLMAAEIDFTRPNPVVEIEQLFQTGRAAHTFFYDVTPEGRFAILEPIQEDDPQAPKPIHLRITENWTAGLHGSKGGGK